MKTRQFLPLLILAFAVPMFAAKKAPTAPGTYKAWGPDIDQFEIVKTFKPSDYANIVIEKLDVSATPRSEDADVAEKVSKVLDIATEPFTAGLKDNLQGLTIAGESGARTLIVRGKVTTLDPGSRGKRMFVGYGAGAARAAITGEIVDASTGEVLVRFTQERRSGIERFGRGSSYEEIMKRTILAIGRDVANILKAL